jgi:hypothetical protein
MTCETTRLLTGAALAAGLLAGPLLTGAMEAAAGDTPVTVEQVPESKQREQSARDEGLLPEDAPERCLDPDVAASDPACVRDKALEDFSRSLGLPLIEDPAFDRAPLVPGVTINQPRRKTRP